MRIPRLFASLPKAIIFTSFSLSCLFAFQTSAFVITKTSFSRKVVCSSSANVQSSASGTDEEKSVLQSKLEILQGVVQELDLQTKQKDVEFSRISEMNQGHIINLENQLKLMKRQHQQQEHISFQEKENLLKEAKIDAKSLEKMTVELKEQEELAKRLEARLHDYNKSMEKMKETIDTNRATISELENERKRTVKIWKEDKDALIYVEEQLKKAQHQIMKQEEDIIHAQKQAQLCSSESSERVEIATASVQAAEARTEKAMEQLSNSDQKLKKIQFQVKLQQLLIHGLLDERWPPALAEKLRDKKQKSP